MAQAKSGDTVKVHYTGKLKDGSIFDSSLNRDPFQFKIGEQQVIPGFEDGISGMEIGEKKSIEIPADKAYGPYRDDLVIAIDPGQIPDGEKVEVGQMLEMRSPDGQTIFVTVAEIADDKITLDANPPLAGQDLIFEVELLEIA